MTIMPKVISSIVPQKEFRPRTVRSSSLFISMSAIEAMTDHADEGYLDNKEIMGLMMGRSYSDDIGEYVLVTDIATSGLDSDEVSVRFNHDSLEDLFESIDTSDGKNIVGWYHSHPGFGCYLSSTDMKTHEGIFGEELGFAVVIDPSDSTLKAFTFCNGEVKEVSMIIMESE